MANLLTGFRIIVSVALLFVPTYSVWFYFLYISAGISDMLDGFVARKFNEESRFGAIFDSIADVVFVLVCFIKFIPLYDIPTWLYVWISIIALMKIGNTLCGAAIHKTIIAEHTVMNKIAGILLFVFPLAHMVIPFKIGAFALCAVASFAAIQEGYFIKRGIVVE